MTGKMSDFGTYVFFALDRIEAAGPETAAALVAEARAMRDAADALERRSANLAGINAMKHGIELLAISQPGAIR